jgi:hypothetical protein
LSDPLRQPMAEVFGFPLNNFSSLAEHYRHNKLCPFNNKVPNCTKDKANDPLGVCSINDGNKGVTITCPVRFRQDWVITSDAAAFFFPAAAQWTSLVEVALKDKNNQSAGNIDVILVASDKQGKVLDFGSIEIQAVYISGNIRDPFKQYMNDPATQYNQEWLGPHYPRPDYLSSSRKRLAPQLLFKGGILKAWNKKMVVALHTSFYNRLPSLTEVDSPEEGDIAWLLYDLILDETQNRYILTRTKTVYTKFENALDRITKPEVGEVSKFVGILQKKLDERLTAPISPILTDEELT